MEVTVYTTTTCPYCVQTKEFLKRHKIKYREINVLDNEKAGTDIMTRSGQSGVPQIEIKDKDRITIIVGFNQDALKKALKL